MMVSETEQLCPVDIHNYNQQRKEQQIFFRSSKDSASDNHRWRTSTQDAFRKPDIEKFSVNGRRKELVRKTLSERVLEKIVNQMNANEAVDDGDKPSEYIDQFCDPAFTPFMDQADNDVNKLMKYSLYACNNQTLYKERIERGELKSRSEISNWNEPFRRNCSFTTSPDQAFREPTGGY